MAFYRQSDACPKFNATHGSSSGANWGRNDYPRSVPVQAPGMLEPNMEVTTRWTPYGTSMTRPYFGGWDALRGRLMHVPQADSYDSSANPFPANPVDDQPNAAMHLMRLTPTTSVHPGYMAPTGPSPTALFHAPPVFGLQTVPIPAVGT